MTTPATPLFPYTSVPAHDDEPLVVPVFGVWPRFKAAFIDGFILGIMGMILALVVIFGADRPAMLMNPPTTEAQMERYLTDYIEWQTDITVISNWVSLVLYSIYYIGFWGAFGATPGKMMTGQKIVTSKGYPIGFGRAFVRFLGWLVGGTFLNLGYAIMAFDRQKRALHDHIAGTRVVPADMPIPDDDTPLTFAAEGSSGGEIVLVLAWYALMCGMMAMLAGVIIYAWPELMAEMQRL